MGSNMRYKSPIRVYLYHGGLLLVHNTTRSVSGAEVDRAVVVNTYLRTLYAISNKQGYVSTSSQQQQFPTAYSLSLMNPPS